MRKFLKFMYDDNVYYKYYEVIHILFHTGMRLSEFCGLTLRDIDRENNVINIDHQIQRTSDMRPVIESTKTNTGTRKLPITEDVAQCFRTIIEDREEPKCEKVVDGYAGFLFNDKNGYPEVAIHWDTDSTTWSSGTTIYIGCRCRISLPTSAAIPTTATWRSPV